MLQVLTAQMIAEDRERAIQRRLGQDAVRRDAMAANAAQRVRPADVHDPAIHPAGRRCGACRPSAVGAC